MTGDDNYRIGDFFKVYSLAYDFRSVPSLWNAEQLAAKAEQAASWWLEVPLGPEQARSLSLVSHSSQPPPDWPLPAVLSNIRLSEISHITDVSKIEWWQFGKSDSVSARTWAIELLELSVRQIQPEADERRNSGHVRKKARLEGLIEAAHVNGGLIEPDKLRRAAMTFRDDSWVLRLFAIVAATLPFAEGEQPRSEPDGAAAGSGVAGVDLVLPDRFVSSEARDFGRVAVESMVARLRHLAEDDHVGPDDEASCRRWVSVLTDMLGMDEEPVTALNASMIAAWRLAERLDPPDVDVIAEQLVAVGYSPQDAVAEAELVVAVEEALLAGTTNDGSEWSPVFEAAAAGGAVTRPPTPEPAWDDLRGQAKKAAIEGASESVRRWFAHPGKTITGVAVTVLTISTILTGVRPFTADLLRWALAAVRQRIGIPPAP